MIKHTVIFYLVDGKVLEYSFFANEDATVRNWWVVKTEDGVERPVDVAIHKREALEDAMGDPSAP